VDAQSATHTLLARRFAEAGTVLLKNKDHLLPIREGVRTIAVIGDDGNLNPTATGGGSGHVIPPYIVTPYQGIKTRAGSGRHVTYAPSNPVSQAVALARAADIAIVFVATDSSEGSDRKNLSLGSGQDELVQAVAAAQPNTIVVAHCPGSVLMPWESKVSSILAAFLPGQEDGHAIASVLFGDLNPSARLPVTFPRTQSEIPVNTPQQYPGINDQASYSERLLVGYRWYDQKNVAPLFAFGHGLSYTNFTYSNLRVSGSINAGWEIQVDVKNTGLAPGFEVPQLYLGFPSTAGEPPKVLRGFHKIVLGLNDLKTVHFKLSKREISIWDVNVHNWSPVKGVIRIYVGASSRDIRVTTTFTA